ncbi:HK97 family phage prohead protease [Altererythrobacter aquiaggeris]|uniref:HK97 family phage prohead protease n=1 Tax=Aestuarierythrobacter aquiaggeris TaxID=1898396 RepID=UPI003018531E
MTRPLHFAGYAALFGRADGSRDTIRPGAFERSISERRSQLPLYWQHRPDQQIGRVLEISEDAKGLRIIAAIDNPEGLAGKLLARREVDGLSFGYRARRFHHTIAGRVLEDIDLHEISLVTHPLQHGARVHLIS